MSRFFVPVALSDVEAIACLAACGAVAAAGASSITPEHPLFTGMLKIDAAYKAAANRHEKIEDLPDEA